MFSSKKNVFNAALKSGKKPYKHPLEQNHQEPVNFLNFNHNYQ